LRDLVESRRQMLENIQSSCLIQLENWARHAEDLAAIMPLAKRPRDRTSMNILLDDQRKVVKALTRLQKDVLELLDG
jgi:hypothetical protein